MVQDFEKFVKNIYKKIPKCVKFAFISAVIIGFLTHCFMLTNKLPNHDDIGQIYDTMSRANMGRWFLKYPAAISSIFSIPWLNGLLTIIYIATASALITDLLKLKKPLHAVLLSAIMVTFPVVASTFSYMNLADCYAFSLLLSTMAVYFTQKYKYGLIIGSLFISLSLGIYQSYFGFATSMFIVILIFDVLKNKEQNSMKQFIIKCLKYISALLIGMLIYLLIVKLGGELTSYKGIDTMGSLPLKDIPITVLNAYKEFYFFFVRNSFYYQFSFMKILYILSAVFGTASLFYFLYLKKSKLINYILVLLLLIILPLGANIVYIMAWNTSVHILMIYGLVSIFILAIGLMDNISVYNGRVKMLLPNITTWFLGIMLLFSLYNNIYISNKAYFKLNMIYEQGYAYTNRLVGRIENLEDYNKTYNVVFVGNPSLGIDNKHLNSQDLKKMTGIIGSIPNTWNYKMFPQNYAAFGNKIIKMENLEKKTTNQVKEVLKDMPNYPENGSVKIIEELILVKFSNI